MANEPRWHKFSAETCVTKHSTIKQTKLPNSKRLKSNPVSTIDQAEGHGERQIRKRILFFIGIHCCHLFLARVKRYQRLAISS